MEHEDVNSGEGQVQEFVLTIRANTAGEFKLEYPNHEIMARYMLDKAHEVLAAEFARLALQQAMGQNGHVRPATKADMAKLPADVRDIIERGGR